MTKTDEMQLSRISRAMSEALHLKVLGLFQNISPRSMTIAETTEACDIDPKYLKGVVERFFENERLYCWRDERGTVHYCLWEDRLNTYYIQTVKSYDIFRGEIEVNVYRSPPFVNLPDEDIEDRPHFNRYSLQDEVALVAID